MILVTGATGTVGRLLVDLLLAQGAEVRAVTRQPDVAALPSGAEVVAGNLSSALKGVTAVFLNPRVIGEHAAELLALAQEQGVRRVVALSAVNVDDPLDEQPSRHNGDRNKEVEAAAVASGLEWTSLRAASFASNTLRAWGPQLRAGDVVRYPCADFREALVDERDLAEVAVRALLADELLGRKVELTGPEAVSHAEAVAVLGSVLDRPLRFQEVPAEAARQGMIARGFAEPFVAALMARYGRQVPQLPSGEVERILGRPARSYAQWAADHAGAFRG
ncbi:NAD(P)H-binding protein [Kitasatospora sp. NPDC048296]|uniref:NAD(P)H-binding protein n=1 Tax=Kitasatospora sp. NPDC048296 TaxID=3364048 RepID=UPI003723B50A